MQTRSLTSIQTQRLQPDVRAANPVGRPADIVVIDMSAADRAPTTDHTATIDRLARSKLRGAQWLLAHIHADGRVATVDEGFRFYRLP